MKSTMKSTMMSTLLIAIMVSIMVSIMLIVSCAVPKDQANSLIEVTDDYESIELTGWGIRRCSSQYPRNRSFRAITEDGVDRIGVVCCVYSLRRCIVRWNSQEQ